LLLHQRDGVLRRHDGAFNESAYATLSLIGAAVVEASIVSGRSPATPIGPGASAGAARSRR
jgi:hypothetical protein